MPDIYKSLFKLLLFKLNPEQAHHFTFFLLKAVGYIPFANYLLRKSYNLNAPKLEKTVFGIRFPNPVGLAAGMDKNGVAFDALANIGFGFVEIGTVTPKPQFGNPMPRLFRLPVDNALINRMGFNNDGVDEVAKRLKKRNKNLVIGGNIGKNKTTPNDNALEDYKICLEKLYDCVDYFVVNVSSPNTPGLRELQEKEPLMQLLSSLKLFGNELASQKNTDAKPILLKIAPDLTESQLDDIVAIVLETQIAGIIATNTTIGREGLKTDSEEIGRIGTGGLSGKPVKNRSTDVIKYIHKKSNGAFPIIGVGGIHSAADALEKLHAGASLVQLYTGFVYEGPQLIGDINRAVLKMDK